MIYLFNMEHIYIPKCALYSNGQHYNKKNSHDQPAEQQYRVRIPYLSHWKILKRGKIIVFYVQYWNLSLLIKVKQIHTGSSTTVDRY